MGVAPPLGALQLMTRLVDFGLAAAPPVGALKTLDWASAGLVPEITDTAHVVAPATPVTPKSDAATKSAT